MKTVHGDLVTYETLCALAKMEGDPVVSVFHPTVRATFHQQHNRNLLKTLLARSEPLLNARGLKPKEIHRLLEPARRLIGDEGFWRQRSEGVAVFVAADLLRTYRLPFRVPELVEVSNAPCIRPLLPALAHQGRFYVLALSRGQVRLLQGSSDHFEEQDLSDLDIPSSLSDALRYDDFSREMQSHASTRAVGRLQTHSQAASRSGRHVWHSHGSRDQQVKGETARFLRAVDGGICKLLAGEEAPLILAAVGFEQDLYRLISSYPRIAAEGIEGNPDKVSSAELHAAASTIAHAMKGPREASVLAYREATSVGDASDNLEEILRAAHEGRVSALLVRARAESWGEYAAGTVEVHNHPQPLDSDLLDLAVRQTLLHGGEAYLIEEGSMPAETELAAVFRF